MLRAFGRNVRAQVVTVRIVAGKGTQLTFATEDWPRNSFRGQFFGPQATRQLIWKGGLSKLVAHMVQRVNRHFSGAQLQLHG